MIHKIPHVPFEIRSLDPASKLSPKCPMLCAEHREPEAMRFHIESVCHQEFPRAADSDDALRHARAGAAMAQTLHGARAFLIRDWSGEGGPLVELRLIDA